MIGRKSQKAFLCGFIAGRYRVIVRLCDVRLLNQTHSFCKQLFRERRIMKFLTVIICLPLIFSVVFAGDLNPPGPPGSTMKTLFGTNCTP